MSNKQLENIGTLDVFDRGLKYEPREHCPWVAAKDALVSDGD